MIEPGLYNMDCMDAMKQFPDKFFDLAIVDPPYGDGNSQIGGGYASGDCSTDTRRWNRFGQRFERYMQQNRGNLGGEVRQKNHCVGRGPRKRILSGAFPRLTQSNYLGRELF